MTTKTAKIISEMKNVSANQDADQGLARKRSMELDQKPTGFRPDIIRANRALRNIERVNYKGNVRGMNEDLHRIDPDSDIGHSADVLKHIEKTQKQVANLPDKQFRSVLCDDAQRVAEDKSNTFYTFDHTDGRLSYADGDDVKDLEKANPAVSRTLGNDYKGISDTQSEHREHASESIDSNDEVNTATGHGVHEHADGADKSSKADKALKAYFAKRSVSALKTAKKSVAKKRAQKPVQLSLFQQPSM